MALDFQDEDIFHEPIYSAFWDSLNPTPGESLLAGNCRHTELFRSAFNRVSILAVFIAAKVR